MTPLSSELSDPRPDPRTACPECDVELHASTSDEGTPYWVCAVCSGAWDEDDLRRASA